MKGKQTMIAAGLVAALAAVPLSSASAHRHHHGFPLFLPFVAAGAVLGAAATIATAPIAAVTAPPAYYAPPPPPAYYPPSPVYYAPPPGYYGYGYYR